jgi:hypothetical protein
VADYRRQLQTIYLAGFELETFEMFASSMGLTKGHCIAMAEATPEGLKLIGQPGWRMGRLLGVLVTRDGKRVFQAKSELVEATPERLSELESFRQELERLLTAQA